MEPQLGFICGTDLLYLMLIEFKIQLFSDVASMKFKSAFLRLATFLSCRA